MNSEQGQFVSRGGLKLDAALDAFGLDVAGWTCADLGANVGGFTDCLLQRGAAKIFAVDTGYGTLAWKLRNDERVEVLERTNALHATPQTALDLVVIDLGWTRQRYAIPAALRWKPRHIVTLIKPHYESETPGVLDDATAEQVACRTLNAMPALGVRVIDLVRSPIRGGGKRGKSKAGNIEFLAHLQPVDGLAGNSILL